MVKNKATLAFNSLPTIKNKSIEDVYILHISAKKNTYNNSWWMRMSFTVSEESPTDTNHRLNRDAYVPH